MQMAGARRLPSRSSATSVSGREKHAAHHPRLRRGRDLDCLLQKRSLFEVLKSLPELLLRVHNDRPVPCNGLLQRLSRYQKETDSFLPGLDGEFVATIE